MPEHDSHDPFYYHKYYPFDWHKVGEDWLAGGGKYRVKRHGAWWVLTVGGDEDTAEIFASVEAAKGTAEACHEAKLKAFYDVVNSGQEPDPSDYGLDAEDVP